MTDPFDSDSSEQEEEQQSKKKSSEFAKLLEDSFRNTRKSLSPGEKIKSEILSISKEEVFVSTGTMHDGIVPRKDFLDADGKFTLKVGDRVELFVIHAKGAEIYLSPKATAKNVADDLEDAFDMMLPIEGRVTELCKGGFRVSIQGKSAFCPISQMDLKRIEVGDEYIGKKFDFMITQFSERGRNVVVSRRKLLEEQKGISESTFMEDHKPGEILAGTITRIEKFGAFVEILPGIEGLVHISELSWVRVSEPHEVVTIGQQVSVKLMGFEEKEGRLKISLSIKQAEKESGTDSWAKALEKFPVGTIAKGKITRREHYGLFVQIEEGVVGLLPKSKALEDNQFPYDRLKIGDETTVQVAEINLDQRRISLSPPQDPGRDDWKGFSQESSGSFGTLGDKFRQALEKKKG